MMYLSFVGTFITLFALIWKRRSHPWNIYLLTLFTLCEGYSVGVLTSMYDQTLVLQAVILTFSMFVFLTLFTFQTRLRFEGMGPFLFASLWVCFLFEFT